MPSILIVCTANICRSPMAGALLQRKLAIVEPDGDWRVTSAGTWAAEGYPAAEKGQTLLRELGLDLSVHRSRIVTRELLAAADLVLTMEQGHKEALCVEFPEFASRVFLLSEMVGRVQDVADPIGGTLADFQDTVRELYLYIEQGIHRIIQIAGENAAS